MNPFNDKNNEEQILCIEDILKQNTDKKDVKFLAELSFERIKLKIQSDNYFIAQYWEYKDAQKIIELLDLKRFSYTEKVKELVSLNELMFEDLIATEFELFTLGFGYRRSSVNTEDDEELYNKMKTEIEEDANLKDFFKRHRDNRQAEIMTKYPDLYKDIEKYKNLKRYLETTEVQNTEPVIPDHEKEVGRAVLQAGKKRGEAKRTEKERNQKKCYELYDKKMKESHRLKSEAKIKKEIADEMHFDVKTIIRYLQERTDRTE